MSQQVLIYIFIIIFPVKKKQSSNESGYPTARELDSILIPSNEVEASRVSHLLSNETETSLLNLSSNEADTTVMLHLLLNENSNNFNDECKCREYQCQT